MRPANVKIKKSSIYLTLAFVALVLVTVDSGVARQFEPQRLELEGTTMGTITWNLVAYARPTHSAEIRVAIEKALNDVNDAGRSHSL